MLARWSDLPNDLLENIFARTFPCDHLEFTSVCSSWRSVELQQQHRYLPRQYVGLIVPGETPDSETRRLIEPVQGQYNNNKVAINLQIPPNYHCCGSSLGWLVLVDELVDGSLDMQLFNPLTGVKFQLPSVISPSSTSPGFDKIAKRNVDKAVLSCDPCSSTSSQAIVFIIYGTWNMVFCKIGDNKWTSVAKIELNLGLKTYVDAIYYKDKFYALYNCHTPGGLVACDVSDGDHPILTYYASPPPCKVYPMAGYLVESNGDLFQLKRYVKYDLQDYYSSESDNNDDFDGVENGQGEDQNDEEQVEDDDEGEVTDDNDEHNNDDGGNAEHEKVDWTELRRRYRTSRFKIYKLLEYDESHHGRWKEVDNIGDNAFFVGSNSSFSLSASDYLGCKPNSVYFTEKKTYEGLHAPIRHDIGVYYIEDKSVAEVYPMDSKPMRPLPFWFTPIPWKSQVGSKAGKREQEQNSEAAIHE